MSFSIVLSPPLSLPHSHEHDSHTNYLIPSICSPINSLYNSSPLEPVIAFKLLGESPISLSWSRSIDRRDDGEYNDEEDDGDDDDEEDRSLDLLVRFVQNMLKKISKRARGAVRSVLPISISAKVVGFSVNGVLILAFLWIMKAFLEVVCILGSVLFVSILLIYGVWTGVTHLQENYNLKVKEFDDQNRTWIGA